MIKNWVAHIWTGETHVDGQVSGGGGEEHVRHGLLHASEHGPSAGALHQRAPLHRRLQAWQRRATHGAPLFLTRNP
jgi:hypothetical protein